VCCWLDRWAVLDKSLSQVRWFLAANSRARPATTPRTARVAPLRASAFALLLSMVREVTAEFASNRHKCCRDAEADARLILLADSESGGERPEPERRRLLLQYAGNHICEHSKISSAMLLPCQQ